MVAIQQDYLTQQYAASVGAYDSIESSYMNTAYNPYNSIFSGGYGGYAGGNVQQYETYNSQYTDSNVRMTQKTAAAQSLVDAPEKAIERRMGVFQRQVQQGNQDNIKEEYDKMYNEVKAMYNSAGYTEVADSQIKAYIDDVYTQKTSSRIVDDLNKYGTNTFLNGVVQGTGIGYLLQDKTTKEDNISYIYDEKKSLGSEVAKWAGRVVGAVATIVALPFAVKLGAKGVSKVAQGYKGLLTAIK